MRPLTYLLVGLVLAVTGCTSSPNSPDPVDPTVDGAVDEEALAVGLAAMYAGDNPAADDLAEGECFADKLLASTMPAALREGGLLDSSYAVVTEIPTLEEDLAGTVADAQLACTDFIEDSTAAQVSVTKGSLDAEAYAECLRGELDAAAVRASVVASLMGAWDDPALVRLSEAQSSCAEQRSR